MKQCGIYGIQNLVNNKWYIGQSVDVRNRKSGHFRSLRKGQHHNSHLQAAFNKEGEPTFKFFLLDEVPETELDELERWYIRELQTLNPRFGYNLEDGGNLRKHWAEESKLKSSLNQKGRLVSLETRKKMSLARLGKPLNREALRKRMEFWKTHGGSPSKGKHWPLEMRQQIATTLRGRHLTAEARAKLVGLHAGERHWNYGKHLSEETKQKISLSRTGKRLGIKMSEETKRKIGAANRGRKPHTFGRHLSPETRRKISVAQKGSKGNNYGKHLSPDEKIRHGIVVKLGWAKRQARLLEERTNDGTLSMAGPQQGLPSTHTQ